MVHFCYVLKMKLVLVFSAFVLRPKSYKELAQNPRIAVQGFIVVFLSSFSLWLGGVGIELFNGGVSEDRIWAFTWIFPSMVAGWLCWSLLAYLAVHLNKKSITVGNLLGALGYAHLPGSFYALIMLPGLGALINLFILIWITAGGTIAIKSVSNISAWLSLLISSIGIATYIIVRNLLQP